MITAALIAFFFAFVLSWAAKPTPGGVNTNTILILPASFLWALGFVLLLIGLVLL